MKSTYKLLTIYLDGKNCPESVPVFCAAEEIINCPSLPEHTTLFDYPKCSRKVSGKHLLTQDSIHSITDNIKQMLACHELIIVWDYASMSDVANQLFARRILQIALILSKANPSVTITHAVPSEKLDYYRQLVNSIYSSQVTIQ